MVESQQERATQTQGTWEERVPGNLGLRLPDPGSEQKSKPQRKKGTVQGGSGSVGWLLGGRRCRPGPGKQADPLVGWAQGTGKSGHGDSAVLSASPAADVKQKLLAAHPFYPWGHHARYTMSTCLALLPCLSIPSGHFLQLS